MPPIADLLAIKVELLRQKDETDAQLSSIKESMEKVDHDILEAMSAAGMTKDGAKVAEHGLTVTRRTKWRAKYDPEKWADIFKWAAENGKEYLIHRRLSDAKVMELVDEGVQLPDGLTTEAFPSLDFRRSAT